MKQKLLLVIMIVILVSISWVLIYSQNSWEYELTQEEQLLLQEHEESLWESTQTSDQEINKDEVKGKLKTIRQKLALKWLIHKWDLNFTNEKYTSALVNYLQIQRKIPEDKENIHKIALTYFQLQKYDKATEYFWKVTDFPKVDKHKAALAKGYSTVVTPDTLSGAIQELEKLPFNDEERFYYGNSLLCAVDFHKCKLAFQNYFSEKEGLAKIKIESLKKKQEEKEKAAIEKWETFTPTPIEVPVIKFPELENIRQALINYDNFKMHDLSYKWGLISLAFMKNKNYPIAIRTWRDVLKNFPDYRPAIKIIAMSYYEMWDYLNAKKFLQKYNKLWDNDPQISYALWIVYQKLKEYVLSSIHLKKAIRLNYEHKIDVRRRQIFNYYEIWDTEKMLSAFDQMISENKENLTEQDLSLAIFHNIVWNNFNKALEYAKIWNEKYPDTDTFFGYIGWLQLEQAQTQEEFAVAKESLKKWLEINRKSAMIHFSLWRLDVKSKKHKEALLYFKKTISLDKHGDFTDLAREQIQLIEDGNFLNN